ncbi:hypothetical protein [Yeosuana marina]|uniref:hypothetical protein n=1 Tax=Yeosuana marina TaxID=1565536 RepID=UPI00141F9FCC|nr:hypothetical protein [Yeosuana marina]|tara:strand:- start:341 stop:781 length:441 start_codon:yes stop_codon:yes gene_type:complete
MMNFNIKIGITFVLSIFANIVFGQNDSLNTDWNKIIVGKWVNKIERTADGKEYAELSCRDTIQYLSNGKYISKQCVWNETGKWKLSDKGDEIIHFDINNEYWKKELGTDDLGESHCKIISLTESQLVTQLFSEDVGEIHQFYIRLE